MFLPHVGLKLVQCRELDLLAFLFALFAMELQFAMCSLNVPAEGGGGVEPVGASLLGTHVRCHFEMSGSYVSLESLMLPEALITSLVTPASEALGAFMDGGMSS